MVLLLIKALHIAAVIFWLAALLYLPRLFVYHAEALNVVKAKARDSGQDSDPQETEQALLKAQGQAEIFVVMERRLLRAIATPALVATLILGLILVAHLGAGATRPWFLLKFILVLGLFAFHGLVAKWRKQLEQATEDFATENFASSSSYPSGKFLRWMNEVPAVLAILIVILVVLKFPA